MQISHRAPADATAPASAVASLPNPAAAPVPRLAVCCRISELLPLVRQAHDAAREARLAGERPGVAAATRAA